MKRICIGVLGSSARVLSVSFVITIAGAVCTLCMIHAVGAAQVFGGGATQVQDAGSSGWIEGRVVFDQGPRGLRTYEIYAQQAGVTKGVGRVVATTDYKFKVPKLKPGQYDIVTDGGLPYRIPALRRVEVRAGQPTSITLSLKSGQPLLEEKPGYDSTSQKGWVEGTVTFDKGPGGLWVRDIRLLQSGRGEVNW